MCSLLQVPYRNAANTKLNEFIKIAAEYKAQTVKKNENPPININKSKKSDESPDLSPFDEQVLDCLHKIGIEIEAERKARAGTDFIGFFEHIGETSAHAPHAVEHVASVLHSEVEETRLAFYNLEHLGLIGAPSATNGYPTITRKGREWLIARHRGRN
jgi:hypothetical protein